jgi:outer membrane protein insertion porin family
MVYTRSNVRGKAETITLGAIGGPLLRRATFAWTNPTFRWTKWSSNFTSTGEINKENPIFNSRLAQVVWQLQRPLDDQQTKTFLLRYSLTRTALRDVVIPDLIPQEDLHTRLSTFSGTYVRDTRDNALDAHTGLYQSYQLDFNARILGSNVSFARLLLQTAYYRPLTETVVWANSVRLGLVQSFAGSHVPLSELFFTGGGSTLRGFPLNGAGPQRTLPACSDAADPASCSLIRVPVGGTQLLIFNSEFRIPVPIKKNLSLAAFYDGGNVFHPIGFHRFRSQYTNSIGFGFRYATPVGPIRVDIGRNLNRIEGVKATQIFITLGQAF